LTLAEDVVHDALISWNAALLDGDAADAIAKLKAQPGKNILKYGFTDLDRMLIAHDLVEYRLTIPVVVGKGAGLFDGVDPSNLKLRLTSAKAAPNGLAILTYARADS